MTKKDDKTPAAASGAISAMAQQVTAGVEKTKAKLTNAERFPTAAKQEAEKAAKKAATATAKAAGTAAEKPAKKTVVQPKFVGRTVRQGAPVHVIAVGDRPQGGTRMYAHTHAALALFGMFEDREVPRPALLAFLGDTAVSYHTRERNLEDRPNGMVRLTAAGKGKFLGRLTSGKVDTAMAMKFQDLFITGKIDPSLSVPAKSVYPVKF